MSRPPLRWLGRILGEAVAGPANVRLGLDEAIQQVLEASGQCLAKAKLTLDSQSIVACLALAGATEPIELEAVRTYRHPFRHVVVTTDAHAACVGAHRGEDGGVIVVGNGHGRLGGARGGALSRRGVGLPRLRRGQRRVARLRTRAPRVLGARWACALDRLADRCLRAVWFRPPCDRALDGVGEAARFAELAPLVVQHAVLNDPVGCELMQSAGRHVDGLAERLRAIGVQRMALAGGLSSSLEPWLSQETKRRLVPAAADALAGALWLARAEAERAAFAN